MWGLSHFAASKLCPGKNDKQATTRKLEEEEDYKSDESCGRIVESETVAVGKVQATPKQETIFCNLQVTGLTD